MNHVFRVIWNDALQAWQAVSETAGCSCKKSKARQSRRALRFSLVALATGLTGQAWAELPVGGSVTAGSGSISVNGNTMTINQSTQRMVTDWQSFSIGAGKTVEFVQPSSSAAALNRVLGADVSTIQGALRANGQVFLLNPNGVLFTPTARVNVGSLVTSTLNVSNTDFMAGKLNFAGDSPNAIINQGSITAASGGTIALVAARIVNAPNASLTADGGKVLLGAGSKVTLDLGGPVHIKVDQGALQALIEQGGAVQADGGLIYMTAKSAEALGRTVINHTGISRAQTVVTGQKGEIYLMGGMEKDSIQVAGTLNASAPQGGDGGFIETSAARVNISDGVSITTAATAGATGKWLIDPINYTVSAFGGDISGATLGANLATNNVIIDTTVAGDGAGDIFIRDNIAKTSGAATTLTLLAYRNIDIGGRLDTDKVAIQGSNQSPLNLVFSARATGGTTTGHVVIRNTTIKTYGGDITIGGGDSTASGYAIAQKPEYDGAAGVHISYDSLIDASSDARATQATYSHWSGTRKYFSAGSSSDTGGNITIRGQGNASTLNINGAVQPNLGIWLWRGASISTAGNGAITLDGTGGNGNVFTFGRVASVGVLLESRSHLIAKDGDISIQGRAGTGWDAYGVAFTEGDGLIKTGGALRINQTDGTANKNDNAVLIRDGVMTFDVGAASDISAPLVGGTSNARISPDYSFVKKGVGSLTLSGDAKAWNWPRPITTSAAKDTGSFDVQDGDLLLASGLTMAQALYSFYVPPVNSNTFGYSLGAIGGASTAPFASGEPVRITSASATRLREESQANRDARDTAIRESIKRQFILTGMSLEELEQQAATFGFVLTDADRAGAVARRAELISLGVLPYYGTSPLSPSEKVAYEKAVKDRSSMIARGIAPARMSGSERVALAKVQTKMIAEGITPPNATPQQRALAEKNRREMIAKGIAPKNATAAERVQAAGGKVNSFVRGLFRR